jgi:predicted amidohydrolase
MRTLTVAALQLAAHDREQFAAVWPAICERIEAAARDGAELAVLPEGTIPAYVLGKAALDLPAVERAVRELQGLANRHKIVIVCGAARPEGQHTYNSALVIEADGSIAGYADKCFLWHFDRHWFAPGRRIAPIHTSLGTLGVLICADGRMPGIARSLTDRGAELLVMPTAWVTSGRDPDALENVQADLLAPLRAWENGIPFVAANKCGVERGCVAYCGKSQAVDAGGSVRALAGQGSAETLVTTLTIGPSSRTRRSPASPAARNGVGAPSRIAIAAEPADARTFEAMRVVEATHLVAPDSATALRDLDAVVPTVQVDDGTISDPAGLIPFRRAGYVLVVWNVRTCDPGWVELLARSRALELRQYVVVIDERVRRAFAVDPDGTIVAGTFGAYRLASFTLDPVRSQQTLVAPGTDIAAGLERVASITECA